MIWWLLPSAEGRIPATLCVKQKLSKGKKKRQRRKKSAIKIKKKRKLTRNQLWFEKTLYMHYVI